jgi:hypothetical protein
VVREEECRASLHCSGRERPVLMFRGMGLPGVKRVWVELVEGGIRRREMRSRRGVMRCMVRE